MESSILVGLITAGATLAGILLGGFLNRNKTDAETRKINAETEGERTKNFANTIDVYNIVHKELGDELKKVIHKCIELTSEMGIFREENNLLKKEVRELRHENIALKNEIHILNAKFN